MKKILLIEQCIALLNIIPVYGTKRTRILDKALVISLLLSGGSARLWTWTHVEENLSDLPYAAFDAIRVLASSRKIMIAPLNYSEFYNRDWINGLVTDYPIFSVSTTPLTTQEITRRTKRYGRLAGISDDYLNLRTLSNTHQALLRMYGDGETVARVLRLPTIWDIQLPEEKLFRHSAETQPERIPRDPRLHGIGRRKSSLLVSGR
jgi:hypothetical protein